MRLAAEAVGLKSEGVAELLAPTLGGLTSAAVRKWWLGTSEPPVSVLGLYAEKLNCSLYWLITGRTDPEALLAHLGIAVERLHAAVAVGEEASMAWERILGQAGLLEPEERAVLIAAGAGPDRSEGLLRSLVGFQLTPKQRQLVTDLVQELSGSHAGESASRAPDHGPTPEGTSE